MIRALTCSFFFLIVFLAASFDLPCGATERLRPRLLVTTDIGGDPDDTQSMVRLMVYANELSIEGLIASAAGTPGELKESVTKPQMIRDLIAAYGKVQKNLTLHAEGFPSADDLLACVKSGNPQRGLKAIGDGHDTEGSRWIIQTADRPDPRPLNIAIWGGQTDLAQALWRVRHDRGPSELKEFLTKLRVYDIADQDGIHHWIYENFPDLFYVLSKADKNKDRRSSVFRGMYLGGDESLTSRAWIDQHVRLEHGPLGALYPTKTHTAPNPHGVMKEGDTPSWLYFLPLGLSDPEQPTWGGWGGRFVPAKHGLFRDAEDTVEKTTDHRVTVWRWRPAFQNDFAARLDWCVKPRDEANHAPRAVMQGEVSRDVLNIEATAGSTLKLSAAGSTDPDGQPLAYRWWNYREAGTFSGEVQLRDANSAAAIAYIPATASGKSIHVVLEVIDNGTPPLTAYRRAVIRVK